MMSTAVLLVILIFARYTPSTLAYTIDQEYYLQIRSLLGLVRVTKSCTVLMLDDVTANDMKMVQNLQGDVDSAAAVMMAAATEKGMLMNTK